MREVTSGGTEWIKHSIMSVRGEGRKRQAADHDLTEARQGKYHYTMGPYSEPVLHIKAGDRVVVETRDAFEGKIKSETDLPTKTLQMPFLNPQNGPIMVEGAEAPPPPTAGRAGQAQVGIGAVIRYAVQVATHVGATGAGAVKFENPQAVKTTTGTAALDIDVVSSGSRAVRPLMSVELYDASGVLKGKGKQQRDAASQRLPVLACCRVAVHRRGLRWPWRDCRTA